MLLGKEKNGSVKKGIGHCVVMELVSPLSNIGYIVYIDNYYSSPTPLLDLKQKGFEACRRVRRIGRDLVRDSSQRV